MGLFNCLKNKKAQIVLPAILLVPTILLVIYLLFETAKLSRFKIRTQFALDSAAFIELTSYSNFLNAVAYTNGAFPFRVFRENMMDTVNRSENAPTSLPEKITYYELFYQAGAFPSMTDMNSNPKSSAGKWELTYKEAPSENKEDLENGMGRPKNWNTENPKVKDDVEYGLNVKELVENYDYFFMMSDDNNSNNPNNNNNNNNNETDQAIVTPLTVYIAVYKMFENIYESQKKVYERLTKDGEFFRKSFYYNSSSCKLSQCGKEGARALKDYNLELDTIRLDKMAWFYRVKWPEQNYTSTEAGKMSFDKEKNEKFMPLYQFSYLTRSSRSKMKKLYTGIDIREPIVPPDNYFRVNVKRYAQKLHVRAALQCTNESNNCVWPNPTSKYQVRLFP